MISNSDNEIFGKYCGLKFGIEILVIGDYVWLIFYLNYIFLNRGFKIFFFFVGEWKKNVILGGGVYDNGCKGCEICELNEKNMCIGR